VVPRFRFVDAPTGEVITSDGCSHRSAFDGRTLRLKEHAQPFRASAC
jgi:hypothetical protein